MSNNIPNFNPDETLYSLFNGIVKQYLINNVFTADLMEITAINEDSTINIKSILQNLDTAGNPIENNAIINNIQVLTIKGGKTSISFNCEVGDIGLYLSLKKDYSKYFKSKDTIITNDSIFNFSNGVFIPLQLNNITNTLIIKNGTGQIEVADTDININASNININGETTINGNTTINGDNTISGNCEASTYSTGNQAGVSGVFIDTGTGASGKSLTITNGLITAIN